MSNLEELKKDMEEKYKVWIGADSYAAAADAAYAYVAAKKKYEKALEKNDD